MWKIELLLRKYANCGDTAVEVMAMSMKCKFSNYRDEYNIILAMGAVLDLRLKLQILKVDYDKVDPNTSEEKVAIIENNLKLLYDEYKTNYWTSSSNISTSPTPDELLNESILEDDLNYISIFFILT